MTTTNPYQTTQENVAKNPFPGTRVSAEEKSRQEYGNSIGAAVWWRWMLRALSSDRVNNIETNRRYGENSQDEDFYRPMVDPTYNEKEGRTSEIWGDEDMMKISWRILSVAKKFCNVITGIIANTRAGIIVSAIDRTSKSEKEHFRKSMMVNLLVKDILAGNNEMEKVLLPDMAISIAGESVMATSREDVEIYIETSLKLRKEIGYEQLIRHVLEKEKYFDFIEPKVLKDLVHIEETYVRCELDQKNRIRIYYGDPAHYVGSETSYPINEYTDYDGEAKLVTISELRELLYSEMDTEELELLLFDIAKRSESGNPGFNIEWRSRSVNDTMKPWNDFRVEALFFKYYTVNVDLYKEEYEDGVAVIRMCGEDDEDDGNMIVDDYQASYEGIYVPCVNRTLNWRRSRCDVRKWTGESWSQRLVKTHLYCNPRGSEGFGGSFIDDIRTSLDMIQFHSLKARKIATELFPPGAYIDWEAISSVTFAGKKVSQKDIIKLLKTKGILVGMSRDENGNLQRMPIEELTGGNVGALMPHYEAIATHIGLIREVVGVNESVDGAGKSSKDLVGVQRMRQVAASNILTYIHRVYSEMTFKRLGETLRAMIQAQIYHGYCEEEYRAVVGDLIYDDLKYDADKPLPVLGIHVNQVPDSDQIQRFESWVANSIESGSISAEDVIDLPDGGSLKAAAQIIKYRARKRIEAQHARKMTEIEANNKGNQDAAMISFDSQLKIIEAEKNAKLEVIAAEAKAKKDVIAAQQMHQGANRLREIDKKGVIDKEKIILAAEQMEDQSQSGNRFAKRPPTFVTPPRKAAMPQVEKGVAATE